MASDECFPFCQLPRCSQKKSEGSTFPIAHRKLENPNWQWTFQSNLNALTLKGESRMVVCCDVFVSPWKENEIFPNWESRSTWWNRKLTNTAVQSLRATFHPPLQPTSFFLLGVVVLMASRCACDTSGGLFRFLFFSLVFFIPSHEKNYMKLCLTIWFIGKAKKKSRKREGKNVSSIGRWEAERGLWKSNE